MLHRPLLHGPCASKTSRMKSINNVIQFDIQFDIQSDVYEIN